MWSDQERLALHGSANSWVSCGTSKAGNLSPSSSLSGPASVQALHGSANSWVSCGTSKAGNLSPSSSLSGPASVQSKQHVLPVACEDQPSSGLAGGPTTSSRTASTSHAAGSSGLPPPAKAQKRPRCKVPPEQRTQLGQLRCRVPTAPPPPLPPLHAVALPFLVSRHPRLPLIRASQKKPPSRARTRSRSLSVTPAPTAGASSRAHQGHGNGDDSDVALNSSDEIEARWHDIIPAVVDMPRLDSSDVESHDEADRRFRPDRDPLSLQVRSFNPDPALRAFKPWKVTQYRLVPMEPRPGRYTLPNPFDRGPMRRADAQAAHEAALAAESRAARKRKRKSSKDPDNAAAQDHPPKRAKSRRSAENEMLQRFRRMENSVKNADCDPSVDLDHSDSHVSDSEDERGPTVGFLYLARRVLREQQEKRRRRRASGRNSAAETDEDDPPQDGAPSSPQL
ncbi:hypothetical protein JCM10908_004098 [Rhodotorula pacifica]|uniref:uncharacterized protein n=1 Tax=Rhodotorula pacifica TaxID=1495444 RepID=UPI00317841B6